MKSKKSYITLGLALFAMFFGAGNLIFPPALGAQSGSDWKLTLLGFLMTGVGLPMLGIITFNKIGSLDKFVEKLPSKVSILYCSLLILALGPLLAIPRTAATTFEMGVHPNFLGVSPLISSVIYFLITYFMVINPSKIIDNIGKILTPIILFMLGVIIFEGITNKMGIPPVMVLNKNPFGHGFLGGYQTMDALGSILIGAIIAQSLRDAGYSKLEDRKYLIFRAAIIAGIGLMLVYGGLLYLGATASVLISGLTRTQMIIFIAHETLGPIGKTVLGLAISAACLTTSSALVMIVGKYFEDITIFTYKQLVLATCVFSSLIAVLGVEKIIEIAVPILTILYPITIVLIVLNFFEIKDKLMFRLGVATTVITSIIELGKTYLGIKIFNLIFNEIPLSKSGFVWLVPVIIVLSMYKFIIILNRRKVKYKLI